jgi:hypothetical protein
MEWKRKNLSLFLIPLIVSICAMCLFVIYLEVHWLSIGVRGTGGYCEVTTEGIVVEPINTWSNVAFVVIGLIVAWQLMWGSFDKNDNCLTRSTFMSIFFSSLVICLGPCSMVMHATYTHEGIELDVLSEYLICAYLVSYGAKRFFRLRIRYFIVIFLLIILICELVSRWNVNIPVLGGPANLLVAVFIIICLVLELLIVFLRRAQIRKRWGIISALTFITAFIIWNFSNPGGRLCFPTSWFQGHALWHVLCAFALYFLFRYYISENSSEQYDLTAKSF